jgi:hypothetical protein
MVATAKANTIPYDAKLGFNNKNISRVVGCATNMIAESTPTQLRNLPMKLLPTREAIITQKPTIQTAANGHK